MKWIYKRFYMIGKQWYAENEAYPYVTFECEADGIVDADNQYQAATGYDPCNSKTGAVLRHCKTMCSDAGCRCRL